MSDFKNIVWIASYPKSGNTWIRNILAKLLFNTSSFSESLYCIQEIYGIQNQQMLLELPTTKINQQEISFLKIHCCFFDLPERYDEILIKTKGFIYIYRHPLDVLLSAINYWRLEANAKQFFEDGQIRTLDELLESGKIEDYLEKFSQSLAIDNWVSMAGRWDENIFSWSKAAKSYPMSAIINYNKMVDEPLKELRKIQKIFPFVSTEKLKEALDYSQQVTQYNPEFDHASLAFFKKVFFWNRTKNTYKRYFSSSAIEAFHRKHQDLLANLNLIEAN